MQFNWSLSTKKFFLDISLSNAILLPNRFVHCQENYQRKKKDKINPNVNKQISHTFVLFVPRHRLQCHSISPPDPCKLQKI